MGPGDHSASQVKCRVSMQSQRDPHEPLGGGVWPSPGNAGGSGDAAPSGKIVYDISCWYRYTLVFVSVRSVLHENLI